MCLALAACGVRRAAMPEEWVAETCRAPGMKPVAVADGPSEWGVD